MRRTTLRTRCVNGSRFFTASEESQGVDIVDCRINRLDDGRRMTVGIAFGDLPEVDVVGQIHALAVGREYHANLRTLRIRRIGFEHDRNLARVEAHEVPHWIDADELGEATDQVLVELLAVVA